MSTNKHKGWEIYQGPPHPVTGVWRAKRHGVGMCAGTREALIRMIDERAKDEWEAGRSLPHLRYHVQYALRDGNVYNLGEFELLKPAQRFAYMCIDEQPGVPIFVTDMDNPELGDVIDQEVDEEENGN